MIAVGQRTLTTETSVNFFKCAAVCVAVFAASISEIAAETPTTATAADSVKLPESTNSIGMEFKLIPAGKFIMGEGDQAHEVTLTKPFKIGVHEVTQAQYEKVMGVNPSFFKGVRNNNLPSAENPVDSVSWKDAVDFCHALSNLPAEKAVGNVYRLPTEAEWEYACRAGTITKFSFGDDEAEIGDFAWYAENAGEPEQVNRGNFYHLLRTHPVGEKRPNAWGLYDMHGNVWEWCQDWYHEYPRDAIIDPAGPTDGSYRVVRGGSFFERMNPSYCSSGFRSKVKDGRGGRNAGFRVVLQ